MPRSFKIIFSIRFRGLYRLHKQVDERQQIGVRGISPFQVALVEGPQDVRVVVCHARNRLDADRAAL